MSSVRTCLLCITAIAAMSMGCSNSSENLPKGKQGQLIINPEGVTRAFVWIPTVSGGLGATISQPHQVWIENTRFNQKQKILVSEKTSGFHLSWTNANTLEVCYADARIYEFRNGIDFAVEQSSEIKSVEIVLRKARSLDLC